MAKIDISKPELFKKLTLKELVEDAVDRGDVEALNWLENESNSTKTRTRDDGTQYEVSKSIVEIRASYVKTFLGYKPASDSAEKARQSKKEKAKKERQDLFAQARARLKV